MSQAAQIAPGLGQITPIAQPTELTQAVVIDLARYVVERVPEEVDVAPLPAASGGTSTSAGVSPALISRDDELDA